MKNQPLSPSPHAHSCPCSSLGPCRSRRLRPKPTIQLRLRCPRRFDRWLEKPARNPLRRCCPRLILVDRCWWPQTHRRLHRRSTQRFQRRRSPWAIGAQSCRRRRTSPRQGRSSLCRRSSPLRSCSSSLRRCSSPLCSCSSLPPLNYHHQHTQLTQTIIASSWFLNSARHRTI